MPLQDSRFFDAVCELQDAKMRGAIYICRCEPQDASNIPSISRDNNESTAAYIYRCCHTRFPARHGQEQAKTNTAVNELHLRKTTRLVHILSYLILSPTIPHTPTHKMYIHTAAKAGSFINSSSICCIISGSSSSRAASISMSWYNGSTIARDTDQSTSNRCRKRPTQGGLSFSPQINDDSEYIHTEHIHEGYCSRRTRNAQEETKIHQNNIYRDDSAVAQHPLVFWQVLAHGTRHRL